MNTEQTRPRSLREIEQEVMAEGREWTRQRLQQRLQAEADRQGGVFPRSQGSVVHRRRRPLQLQTETGVVKLEVLYGQDAADQHWGCPIREHWGLTSHQQLSLALEEKLAFTITATAAYEEAAALAQKWGVPVTDSLLHSLTRRLGSRARPKGKNSWPTRRSKPSPNVRRPNWACSCSMAGRCVSVDRAGEK
ncbi:MAG: hypothetical protein WCH99_21850 [Verrucomicrobiota bacterium]